MIVKTAVGSIVEVVRVADVVFVVLGDEVVEGDATEVEAAAGVEVASDWADVDVAAAEEDSTKIMFVEMKVESGLAIARTSIFEGSGCESLFTLLAVEGVASALASPTLSSLP